MMTHEISATFGDGRKVWAFVNVGPGESAHAAAQTRWPHAIKWTARAVTN